MAYFHRLCIYHFLVGVKHACQVVNDVDLTQLGTALLVCLGIQNHLKLEVVVLAEELDEPEDSGDRVDCS